MNKKQIILISVLSILILVSGLFFLRNYSTAGLTEIKLGNIRCDALSPECGYCPGKIIDEKCYVKR